MGCDVEDCGNTVYDKDDDYPDFALAVAHHVATDLQSMPAHPKGLVDPVALGIVICGSGGGVTMAANKVHGIRAAQGVSVVDVEHNRDHNDMNVLTVGCDISTEEQVKKMIDVYIKTPFGAEERCVRRIQKITDFERRQS